MEVELAPPEGVICQNINLCLESFLNQKCNLVLVNVTFAEFTRFSFLADTLFEKTQRVELSFVRNRCTNEATFANKVLGN